MDQRPGDDMADTLAKIREALYRGSKIEAIKLCREATGQGLAEAKNFVDRLEAELRRQEPERFAAKPAGCGAAVLLLVVLAAGAAVVWA